MIEYDYTFNTHNCSQHRYFNGKEYVEVSREPFTSKLYTKLKERRLIKAKQLRRKDPLGLLNIK